MTAEIRNPSTASLVPFEPLLSPEEAAQLLHIHPKTLVRMARHQEVAAFRVGKKWKFRASALDAWLREQLNCDGQSV